MIVRRVGIIFLVCFSLISRAQSALSSFGGSLSTHHTTAKLILSADTVKPGDTFWAGIDMKMEPGWHTYWKNPGDAGMATKIEWQLPAGITAGDIQWPLPEKLPPVEVTTYGYKDEVMLLVPLTVETNSNLPMGQVDVKAKVSWLECKEVCIPADQTVDTKLNIGAETTASTDAAKIGEWRNGIPDLIKNGGISAWWEEPANGDARSLILEWPEFLNGRMPVSEERLPTDVGDFYPAPQDRFEVQSKTENIIADPLKFRIRKLVKKYSGDWPKEVSGIIIMKSGRAESSFTATFSIADKAPVGEAILQSRTGVPPARTGETPALPWVLLYAFIGGLILNIMPCVLPVIALKILGFVSEARSEPRRVRNLGLIYALGVLISFGVLAGLVIGIKAAGHQAGWGMQFGNPVFVVYLTTVVLLVALNLFGVFEVTPGGRIMNTAGQLTSKHGAPGAFFNGALAVVLATPCTAPFLTSALGFAFAQSASMIVLVFSFVGLGLAAPYVALSCNPALLKFLPKPGPWMQWFKVAMGFPMLATVVWLYGIASSSYGKNVLWLGVFLVVVALAAWIFGEFVQRGRDKTAAVVVVGILLVAGYLFVLEKELDWRRAAPEAGVPGSLKESADGIDWQSWSPDAVAKARAEGHPVLVDFTADWCLTCQVNKKIALEILSVRAKVKEINAVSLIADYTRTPANILAELNRYGRPSVPLVLVYPKNPDLPAIVLPEVLTPGIVLDALNQAAK